MPKPTQNPLHCEHFRSFPNVGCMALAFSRTGLNMYDIVIINVSPMQAKKNKKRFIVFVFKK